MSDHEASLEPWNHSPIEIRRSLKQKYDASEVSYRILGESFIIFEVRDGYELIGESPDAIERIPYWSELWPSAIALAEAVVNDSSLMGCNVVELGAGLGLVSIVASRCGARVRMTDYDPEALCFGAVNAHRNGEALTVSRFDWCKDSFEERFDMVLAADVLYAEENIRPVADCLSNHLEDDGCAWITDPQRPHSGEFLRRIKSLGMAAETEQRVVLFKNREVVVDLHRLSRQP